jgi:TRAP-type C4-dicarboxylate transport system permease small subunit
LEPSLKNLSEKIDDANKRLELLDPDEGLGLADRCVNRLVEAVGVSVLVTIVVVIFANAFSRYVLNYSFSWAEELVQMSMPWLAMTGVFLSVRRGTMIKIDYFFKKIPAHYQPIIAYFGYSLNILILLSMAIVSLEFVFLFGGDEALYVSVPTGFSTSALVWGMAGAAMAYFAEFFRVWKHSNSEKKIRGAKK